jgi:hypothetical protein
MDLSNPELIIYFRVHGNIIQFHLFLLHAKRFDYALSQEGNCHMNQDISWLHFSELTGITAHTLPATYTMCIILLWCVNYEHNCSLPDSLVDCY